MEETDIKTSIGSHLENILGQGIKEKAIVALYNNPGLTYAQLGSVLSVETQQVRVVFDRNRGFFQERQKEGNIKSFEISPIAENFIIESLAKKQTINYQNIKSLQEEENRLKDKRKLEGEILAILDKILEIEENLICIDFEKLSLENPIVADKLIDNPEDIIGFIKEKYKEQIKLKNLPKSCKVNIENLRANHLDKLVILEGRSVSLSTVRPRVIIAKFECSSCGAILSINQTEKKFKEPSRCSCGWKGKFNLLSKEMKNTAKVIIEEIQDNSTSSNLQRLNCFISEELTFSKNIETFYPGNEIKIIGILKEVPIQLQSGISTKFDISLEIIQAELFEPEIDLRQLDDCKEEIIKLSSEIDKNGLSEITESFAPDVYGYKPIKEAVVLQLCSQKNTPGSKPRDKINTCLIGDPGVAKSIIADFSLSITPGSIKAVGGGSSAVGLTASVVKEEEDMGYRIEPGAMVLAKEILIIDELNNLPDEDKPKLQEAMESKTITIHKANVHATLKVTAGILATANPKHGTFKINRDLHSSSVLEQFNITPAILNRFDLIFVMIDKPDKEHDKKVANIIVQRKRNQINPKYNINFLKKFFIYIRNQPEPEITDEINELINNHYILVRESKTEEQLINPRYVETLLRLCQASAKIRLSRIIELKDLERAKEMLKKSNYVNYLFNNKEEEI